MILRRLWLIVLPLATLLAQLRLDVNQMRGDLFAGLAGNKGAFERLLTRTEEALMQDPDNSQALIWHGAATLAQSLAQPAELEVRAPVMERFQKGVSEMDRAVSLAPKDIEVRVIRGVLMVPVSRNMPPPFSDRMLEKARTDFQQVFDLQKNQLRELGTHPLGELLQALGDIYSRQGNTGEAEKYYTLTQSLLPRTEYSQRASTWMKTRQPLPESQTGCIGCHTAK